MTRSQDFLSAKDDLIGSIPDQPRGGPGIGDVVLKVCTLSSEKKYQGFEIINQGDFEGYSRGLSGGPRLERDLFLPEKTNPVPVTEVPPVLHRHCVHQKQVLAGKIGSGIDKLYHWAVTRNKELRCCRRRKHRPLRLNIGYYLIEYH